MQKILICGGAGYIGSHVVRRIKKAGYCPIVFDNLSTGHKQSISQDTIFYLGDLRDKTQIDKVFQENKIDAVMHFCAKSLVGESMLQPYLYFQNNVLGGLNLLQVMQENDVKKIVFSSTAAVYGEPKDIPIMETSYLAPTNVYGETKLTFEKILDWYDKIFQIKYVALRYFNASGADDSGEIGEDHNPESHLLPLIFQVINKQRDFISIFGDDYQTFDGTCIRDYIHVNDLADAHLLVLKYLLEGNDSDVFNLGSGEGYSVKQIIDSINKITNNVVNTKVVSRRDGDPAVLIASSDKIRNKLGWETHYCLDNIINTAYKWHKGHPKGYENSTNS
jgi:UDP-glucose 4-epimerase